MPVRVELNHLMVMDGYYFLNDVLFTGLAYDHRDKTLYKVYQMVDGKISSEQDYGFFERAGFAKFDYDTIEDFYEAYVEFIYQGKPFNGITYDYRDGFVWGELLWVDGYNVESIGWYPDGSGLVEEYEVDYDKYTCKFEWHYKQLISAKVRKGGVSNNIRFTISINEQNKIKSCVLGGDNIADLGELVRCSDLPLPANTLDGLLAHYALADNIYLNINNEVNFNYFIAHVPFQSIKNLRFQTEKFSLSALAPLMDLPNIKSICLNESGLSHYDLERMDEPERTIKQQRCDERDQSLLTLLIAIQAKQPCDIRLISNSDTFVEYTGMAVQQGKIYARVNEANFGYLLTVGILKTAKTLELEASKLSLTTLNKLSTLPNLQKIYFKTDELSASQLEELDEQARAKQLRQFDSRNQELWALLLNLQQQLHCDIKLESDFRVIFESQYNKQ